MGTKEEDNNDYFLNDENSDFIQDVMFSYPMENCSENAFINVYFKNRCVHIKQFSYNGSIEKFSKLAELVTGLENITLYKKERNQKLILIF